MPDLNADAPISRSQAIEASRWLKENFGPQITDAVAGTAFSVNHICGIACQETAYVWQSRLNDLSPDEILALCVLDGSGDFKPEENPRSAFPRNTAAFRERFGDGFTGKLIDAGNESRKLRGFSPVNWIYKGYGIFQYDLQFVIKDEEFFRNQLWLDFGECLKRLMGELSKTWDQQGNLFAAIRAYNGSGRRAEIYAQNVTAYASIAGDEDAAPRATPA